ncbi:DUF3034 family protein [Halomonas alkalisoli]|uniref:DUF3034 family protein n=1 Tax=Halomonas alkalisoli TaxID=2907158 RepID=UPI001F44CB5C|nr:DUF3034 family protein [Halomonas alkalisoli]MCE9684139.1 DUF3034 family protein [Halomonas alkalisoli]
MNRTTTGGWAIGIGVIGLALISVSAQAQSIGSATSGKLLLTGGVSQVEGAAGGGLTPWAVIGGYGTQDQIGGGAYYTHINVDDFSLDSYGALVGFYNRLELSVAQQSFNTRDVGAALGLGQDFRINQNIFGAKVRLFGDAVLDQDTWVPQVSVGVQHKRNDREDLVRALGAEDYKGTDYYLSATKLFLSQSLLVNTTLRYTEANQFGILGFGGDRNSGYSVQPELSVAYLLNRNLAIGAEYRAKPNNLNVAKEDDAWDVFAAWAPTKNVSLTLAYVNLGNVVVDDQTGVYGSVQFSF